MGYICICDSNYDLFKIYFGMLGLLKPTKILQVNVVIIFITIHFWSHGSMTEILTLIVFVYLL